MQFTDDGFPRRCYLNQLTPLELELSNLMVKVEEQGSHPLLTDCLNHLEAARARLADWVELPQAEREEKNAFRARLAELVNPK